MDTLLALMLEYPGTTGYLASILLGGGYLLWRIRAALRSTLRRRQHRLQRWRMFLSVRGGAPPDGEHTLTDAREDALDRVEAQFSVIRRVLLPFTTLVYLFLLALPFLDRMPAAFLSLIVGAITVMLGIAARPVVENLIAGLVVSFSRMLNLGDTVKLDGKYGTVEDIGLTHTVIKLWDWKRYVVPNTRMLQAEFLNYSLQDRWIWAYVEFQVSYDADLATVREIALESPLGCEHFADKEPPQFWITEMRDDAYVCWVAAWSEDPARAWVLGHDMRTHMIEAFRAADIRAHMRHHKIEGGPPGVVPLDGGAASAQNPGPEKV